MTVIARLYSGKVIRQYNEVLGIFFVEDENDEIPT